MTFTTLPIDVPIPGEPTEITYAEKLNDLNVADGVTLHVLEN
jgi:hypothetical protein